ncbi:uncharacterized protein LOC128988529 [Macrosteles quadrilineatus]|uniref:uncharacterized protein LOC128988529 n=1 Tax=Macrosteles quadrilineatus TaxID=74068 RepID=UPI0023E11B90|nr:uncharacterized protein LOC128988529 [Macrosteles quadrilineatus]
MIRLVLVSPFIVILGFYEAKGAPNELSLKNDETSPPYRPIEGTSYLQSVDRLVELSNGSVLFALKLFVNHPVAGAIVIARAVAYKVEKGEEAFGSAALKTVSYVAEKVEAAAKSRFQNEVN